MGKRKPLRACDYPSAAVLTDFVTELHAAQPHIGAERILERRPMPCAPDHLDACVEMDVSALKALAFAFVLSQSRSDGAAYISVSGRRSVRARGMKKVRSTQPWPRIPATDKLRPVSLHRWITMIVYGDPTSDDQQATHTCGNDRCVAGAHLRWQTEAANTEDMAFHGEHPPVHTVQGTRRFSRMAWLP